MEKYLQFALIVLGVMLLAAETSRYLRISPVIGYIFSGILVKNLVEGIHTEAIDLISEIGISFLMFIIGMKLSHKDLKTFKSYTVFSISQVLVTTIIIFFVLYYFVPLMPITNLIILSSGISLSSTALCTQLINENRQHNAESSNSTMAALLFQDFFAILVLMFMQTIMHGPAEVSLMSTIITYSSYICTVVGMIYIVNPIINNALKLVATSVTSESTIIFAVILVLGTSLITNRFGLSTELGPFIAGVLIAGTKYKDQVMSEVYNISKLLLAMFFVSIGMSIDLGFCVKNITIILKILGIVMITKILLILIIFHFCKRKNWKENTKTAVLLSGLGEFTCVIIKNFQTSSKSKQLLESNPQIKDILLIITVVSAISLIISSIIYTMLCSPNSISGKKSEYQVILIGYTKKTEVIAQLLEKTDISYLMIEKDALRLEYVSHLGINAKFGDSENSKLIKSLVADSPIIILGFEANIRRIDSIVKICNLFPNAKIFCYASDETVINKMKCSNIEVLLFSKKEQSFKLATTVLKKIGWSEDQVKELLENAQE